ncbi:hypothetical protein EBE87_21160 [Pseudoroseomonas wenyumeiae]|uniref:Outer membrane beta-barrel porin/alpha-amylase n=1 Tax=Teichococcus wenyumeiae TaxID=2478470 RepID=A0ABX9VEJ5_9PROT|nr:hypothetical protein [Pseudoroseomonas wenyumeiae]RMI19255.1 hypothetical protein EBE87_21160 [Pseudoroseomonas wenyumeiae]
MTRLVRVLAAASYATLATTISCGLAHAQSRGDCEAGIGFIRDAQSRPQDPATRAELGKALRDAQRELGEGEYAECLEAVEDARTILGSGGAAAFHRAGPALEEDERVQGDRDFPVSTEAAGVPDRGEVEVRVLAGYSRLRSLRGMSSGGDDDDEPPGRRSGRDLMTPSIEAEVGLGHNLSASVGLAYAFGNAEEAKTGEAEFTLKWNLLPAQGLRPALTVIGGISAPFGPRHESSETLLGLLASQPLSPGANAPVLYANILWFHALDRGEGERSDRYAASVALAVPVARRTGLFVGYSREQDSEHRRADQFIELGVRQLLPADFILAGGVGIGVGDSETDVRVLFGLQKNF